MLLDQRIIETFDLLPRDRWDQLYEIEILVYDQMWKVFCHGVSEPFEVGVPPPDGPSLWECGHLVGDISVAEVAAYNVAVIGPQTVKVLSDTLVS